MGRRRTRADGERGRSSPWEHPPAGHGRLEGSIRGFRYGPGAPDVGRRATKRPSSPGPFGCDVDDLDLSLLRAMYPRRSWSVWGIDPRVTVLEAARAVGLGRNAARLRQRRWRAEGFWLGTDVWPNPALFGAGVARYELLLASTQRADEVLDRLDAVEGALRAYTGYGDERSPHPGTSVSVLCIDGTRGAVSGRRREQLRRLVPERGVRGPFAMTPPRPTYTPDRLDWRIVRAARAAPDHSSRRLARDLEIPERRARRRWNSLIEGRCLWYIPNFDWSRSPSVVFHVVSDASEHVRAVAHAMESVYPHLLPLEVDPAVYGNRLDPPEGLVVARVPVASAAAVQQVASRLLAIPHVRTVAPDYPLQARSYDRWFAQQLADPPDGADRPTEPADSQ